MAVRIQLRRGNNSEFSGGLQLSAGEAALVEDEKVLIIGDGTSTYSQLKAEGKFINYQTDQGLGKVGGSNATGEIPLKLVGASGQTVATLQVLKNGGSNGILEVFTDNTTELVKINGADGAVDDITLLLKAKASQTAGVLEVQDSSGTTPRFQVKEEGQTLIQPADTTDVSLDVKGSTGSQSNGILRVQKSNGDRILEVKDSNVRSIPEVVLGSIPASHGVPSTYGVVRSGTNPGNTDSSADSENETSPHFLLESEGGAANNQRGKLTLVGNRGVTTAQKSIVVKKNGVSTARLQADFDGNLFLENKATLGGAEIFVTGRTLADASVMRRDEILADLQAFKLYQYNVAAPGVELKIQKLTTTDGSPVSVANTSNLLSTAVVTSSGSASGTDPDMLDTPGGSVFPAIKLVSGESLLFSLTQTAFATSPTDATSQIQINSYTSDSLASGVKTTIRDETNTGNSPEPTSLVHAVTNTSGSDRFIAVASRGTSKLGVSPAELKGQVFISKLMPTLLSTAVGESSAFEITVLS